MRTRPSRHFLSLSFSGCGHLLPYHLGVAASLLQNSQPNVVRGGPSKGVKPKYESRPLLPPIQAVSGSSAGAIAAVILARIPHRLEEFVDSFFSKKGQALTILQSMLFDEERFIMNGHGDGRSNKSIVTPITENSQRSKSPILYIATTKCHDGSSHLTPFSDPTIFSNISCTWSTDDILLGVKASCSIPTSFHPFDLVQFPFSRHVTYPEGEGQVLGDGNSHVDGGIAAPAPRSPHDEMEGAIPIIISPISFQSSSYTSSTQRTKDGIIRISPNDETWRLLPMRNMNLRGGFEVRTSIQNLRALRVASGVTTTEELKGWYQLGMEDGETMYEQMNDEDH